MTKATERPSVTSPSTFRSFGPTTILYVGSKDLKMSGDVTEDRSFVIAGVIFTDRINALRST